MPSANTTAVIDSSSTTGKPASLGYGYVWGTGRRLGYYMLQATGDIFYDYSRVGLWALAEGEWDGCHELWINDSLVWTSEWDDPQHFHFHRGSDAPLGNDLTPVSNGPDQGVDSHWRWFPAGSQPLCFSRLAYYSIWRKQPIENQTNTHQQDPTQWTDINPVGLWRALRVRIFDADGNQTGYAFTTNPIWHFVDVRLRRKLYPEYGIDFTNGIDPIPFAVADKFIWGDIWSSAQYCDTLLANGRRRFTGNYLFAAQTTRAAIEEQILKVCRGYTRETAGKLSILVDRPRSSVFTITREHVLPGSFKPSDQAVSKAANHYVGKMRDLLVPAAAQIASITCADHQNPQLATVAPHPCNTGDRIAIGGTDSLYDGVWSVLSVPTGSNVTTMALVSKGSNYPASVGAGGSLGLLQARFKERAPTFMHEANQLARGAVGVGLPRYLNRIPVTYDLGVSTFDQVSRVVRYERDRALGLDQSPYITPKALPVSIPLFALSADGSGTCAAQIECGDRVTIDEFASFAYQGDYEVLDATEREYNPSVSSSGDSIGLGQAPQGGEKELVLGPYAENVMYDATDPNSASWSNVPGSDPGNDGRFTSIDLAGGGKLAFLSGAVASGGTFDLPSTGFNPANVLAWVSPQGYVEKGHVMHVVADCSVDANRRCSLQYQDGEYNFWGGDLNVAAAAWMGDATAATLSGPAVPITVGNMSWLVLTLDGGEVICLGRGIMADGSQIVLPAGFAWDKAFALASPHDGVPNGNQAHGVGAYVDAGGIVHLNYQDGSGNIWHGDAGAFVFAWQNNSGVVTTETTGGASWMKYTTAAGYVLGAGIGTFADGATLGLPAEAGAADSLQIFPCPHDFSIVAHPAHGVGACYVDYALQVHMFFEDGQGNSWTGTADVFALFYEPSGGSGTSAGGISVVVAPAGASVPPSATIQFSATVLGATNTAVTWAVDGIASGNTEIGTIDGTGLYTAPATDGTHLVTAVSSQNSAAVGNQFVVVGSGAGSSGAAPGVTVSVSPGSVTLPQGGTQQFAASVAGSTASISWAVNGIVGGNSQVGTITSGGLYTAPTGTSGGASVTATVAGVTGGAGVTFGSPGGQY